MSGPTLRVTAISPTGVYSGAERVLRHHAQAGMAQGDDWVIIAPRGAIEAPLADAGITHQVIPELKLGSGPRVIATLRLAVANLQTALRLRSRLRHADVIVANSVMALPVLRLLRLTGLRTPVVWLVHDVITRTDLATVARWSRAAVTRSIAVSHAAAALSEQLGLDTVVIYNGVNTPADPPTEEHPTEAPPPPESSDPHRDALPIIGVNAVLTEWKGQAQMLDAAARIERPYILEFLGGALPKDHGYEQALRQRANQPDLAGRVRFLGQRGDVDATMRRWTIAVSCSIEPEAGPLAVLEAMSLCLPLVVTDHGGAPELSTGCSLVVPPGDAEAMAAAVTTLLDDAELRQQLGGNGCERAREHFDRDELEEQFRAALMTLSTQSRAKQSRAKQGRPTPDQGTQDRTAQHGDTQHGDTQHGDTQHGDTQHGEMR